MDFSEAAFLGLVASQPSLIDEKGSVDKAAVTSGANLQGMRCSTTHVSLPFITKPQSVNQAIYDEHGARQGALRGVRDNDANQKLVVRSAVDSTTTEATGKDAALRIASVYVRTGTMTSAAAVETLFGDLAETPDDDASETDSVETGSVEVPASKPVVLESLRKDQLKSLLQEIGGTVQPSDSKADLIAAISQRNRELQNA